MHVGHSLTLQCLVLGVLLHQLIVETVPLCLLADYCAAYPVLLLLYRIRQVRLRKGRIQQGG